MVVRRLALIAALVTACPQDAPLADTTGMNGTTGTSGEVTTGAPTTGETVDLLEQLRAIDGLDVEEREPPDAQHRFFVMRYSQPVDHDDPDGPQFDQRMTLLHRDVAAPVVMLTAGYAISLDQTDLVEPADLLNANQLVVEHRYFDDSRPVPTDWSHLTIAQAAGDHHRITTALQDAIYAGPWISTGASKSGMAAVFFRRFYPDDVAATIAYVAPLSLGDQDARYLQFVAERGDPGCRDALLKMQREVLVRRPAMLERMQIEAEAEGYTYEFLNPDQALDSAALEFIFTFWQYEDASLCASIPAVEASDDEVWQFLGSITPPAFWSDLYSLYYEPYFWQAATELGYPAYDESNLEGLLKYPGIDVAGNYVVPGPGKDVGLDPAAMADIADWVATGGERLLFVYGENDPYSAAAFELGGAEDSLRMFAPAGNHGAKIADLGKADRTAALAAIEAWTGVTPVPRVNRVPRKTGRVGLRGHTW